MKELNVAGIKNLVFDLGGVILNLSYQKAYKAFAELSGLSVQEIVTLAQEREEFKQYEMGRIGDKEFRHFVRQSMSLACSDVDIDKAWNTMLLNLPKERLQTLQTLQQSYRIFLLSNTNAIHLRKFNTIFEQVSEQSSIHDCFEKCYFSHEVGMRKPDVEIYKHVISDSNLQPKETLFFDDLYTNIEGAVDAGLQPYHVTDANELFKELDQIK